MPKLVLTAGLIAFLACAPGNGALPEPGPSGGRHAHAAGGSAGKHGGRGGVSEAAGSGGMDESSGAGGRENAEGGATNSPGGEANEPGGSPGEGGAEGLTGGTTQAGVGRTGGSSGTASGGVGGDRQTQDPTAINGCVSYEDRTQPGAIRQLAWDENVLSDSARCMKIRLGQTVTFVGDFDSHPLEPYRGDSPSPIAPSATFDVDGVFGFICPVHPTEMFGAIWVVF